MIQPIGRKGLTRLYAPEVITHLSLIILAKQAQFSLDEIANMLKRLPENGIERPISRNIKHYFLQMFRKRVHIQNSTPSHYLF
ncbi:hypothetical protein [Providencia sp. wls1943]|uniref:hypothetical protein n=1 Tax=Providencia sp. wls1943 TaxID=2675150 RepID=UPI001E34B261|nr:hypothetical protein [Providencia sp. wls1943]